MSEELPQSRIRYFLSRNDGGIWGADEPAPGLGRVEAWRSTEITQDGHWRSGEPATRYLSTRERQSVSLAEGDLLVTKASGSPKHVGKTAIVSSRQELGGFSNFMQRLRFRPGHVSRFYWYLLNSRVARAHYAQYATTSSGLKNLDRRLISDVPCPVMSTERQRAVVAFLDRECAQIDDLVRDKQLLVGELDQLRRAELDDLLDNAASARRYRLRDVLQGTPCYGVLVPEFTDYGGVPFIRVNDLEALVSRGDSLVQISHRQALEYNRTRVKPGDVLVSVVGSIDKVAIVPSELDGANVARAVALLRARTDMPPELLVACVRSSRYKEQAARATSADTAQPTLNMGDLARFSVVAPSDAQERSRLAQQVVERHAAYEEAHALIAASIADLRAYREALIGEALMCTIAGRVPSEQLVAG